jgi:hypothetical protein
MLHHFHPVTEKEYEMITPGLVPFKSSSSTLKKMYVNKYLYAQWH